MGQRIEPLLVLARADDIAVISGAGIQVVVVVVKTGIAQRLRLVGRQHAQGRAAFQPQGLDGRNHLADLRDIAVLG